MEKRSLWFATAGALLFANVAVAQQYPMLDAVANKIVQKYQQSTCEQLWQERAAKKSMPKPQGEQMAIQAMHNDPQMRAAFIDRVAAPIANKLFECGMIPLIAPGRAVTFRLIMEAAMTAWVPILRATIVALGLSLAASGGAQQRANPPAKAAAKHAQQTAVPDYQPGLDQHALDIIKAACERLAAAKSMAFTAIVSYENPSRLSPPLIYSTKSEIIMQRPDKLRVITPGDGPRSEFYYDGKTMTAFSPGENLVAMTDAPPTINGALEKAYDVGAIYFPFTDVIVADPYKDIADGLKIAFYIGQSIVVDNTTTDMVAYVTGDVFVQAWIGVQDKLPRRIYAVYLNDPARLRHVLALTNWVLDPAFTASDFVPSDASGAAPIAFERPDAANAPGLKPPRKTRPASAQ